MKTGDACVVPEHVNPRVQGLRPSATVAINDRCNALRRRGKEVFKLGLGQSPFPVPDVVVEALREHASEKDYLNVYGLEALREAVAEHHRRRFGMDCDAGDVLIGPGSKELMFLLQLVYYGDLFIPAPSWVSYAPQARIIGRPVQFVPTTREDHWQLTAAHLERVCERNGSGARLVILNYPSNPTGTTLSDQRLTELAAIARRERVVLLSDEIYGLLHHEGQHHSIVPRYPEGTIFSGGLSKWCGAGGWRLGVFVFPRCLSWLREAMAAVATETFTSTCAPIQYAAVRAFQGGPEIDEYLAKSRRILKALGALLTRLLREGGADVQSPDGGFYLFPDFGAFRERLAARGVTTAAHMCTRLLDETGVAILPGSDFGQPPEQLTARIAYVDFDGRAALDAVRDAAPSSGAEPPEPGESFVRAHCPRVVEAVTRMMAWFNGP